MVEVKHEAWLGFLTVDLVVPKSDSVSVHKRFSGCGFYFESFNGKEREFYDANDVPILEEKVEDF